LQNPHFGYISTFFEFIIKKILLHNQIKLSEKQNMKCICLISCRQRLSVVVHVVAQSIAAALLFAAIVLNANSQTIQPMHGIQTPASEDQRRRAQAEALERQRRLQAPNVDLHTPATTPTASFDTLTLPTESPCFEMHQFVLALPPPLSPAARAAGASDLPFDPFRFAQNYLRQYAGRCIGAQGLNVIVQRLSHVILQKGYSSSRVGIPEQDLSTGVMTVTLVPGVIRSIRFSDPSFYGTPRNAFPTGAGQLLNLRDLEQGLEQMQRVPGQEVDMQIVAADRPG
jgi:hemolysin activation/secretion protein